MADLPQLPSPGEVNDEKQGVFASILESLRTQTSLLFQIDDNTESDETASEKRKRRVKEENTDKKGMFSSALGGLGAGIKGVGGGGCAHETSHGAGPSPHAHSAYIPMYISRASHARLTRIPRTSPRTSRVKSA